ncbi:metalloreductase STEAP4-like [Dreissena polymorpha]|uniref:Metalloreductase STEAP2 n=1 Tax=Dreissena polymorpha TaxID=45954 RepID=A0A9D3Z021_DREPO|nr:metalloreductase STEAP4-like [Dreissena polymorpha]KAH3708216.1 hypothetical protein DPMN_067660 [Dreissena polymorpha]
MSEIEHRQRVGILGTGYFGRALAKRLFFSGYDVILGSREPDRREISPNQDVLYDIKIVSVQECIKSAPILFLAVHFEHVEKLLKEHVQLLSEKILIDVSNRKIPSKLTSHAEEIEKLFPKSRVVKAFNVISAYAMENDYDTSSKQVFIAGNNREAREIVVDITKNMNFRPVDFGVLISSRRIEKHPLRLFPEWRFPIIFAVGVFNGWLLFLIYIYYMFESFYNWEQLSIKVMNKAVCMTSITTLSATYLASSFATIFQLYFGTKHQRFPRWLDTWLKTRKQLGLVSYLLVTVHVIMSLLTMSPTYYPPWYHSTRVRIPANLNSTFEFQRITWMNWKGEATSLVGICAYVVLSLVCVTTFPSVTDKLNWREWRFAQSKMGHAALFLSVAHVLVMAIPVWMKHPDVVYKSIFFVCSLLPWATLVLKFVFMLPCINRYVMKIRKGWIKGEECERHKMNRGYTAVDINNGTPTQSQDVSSIPENVMMLRKI